MKKPLHALSYKVEKGITFTKPSETQPPQTKPIKQMLIDHTRGLVQPETQAHEAVYWPEEMAYPNPQELDFVELQDMKEFYKDRMNEIIKAEKDRKIKEAALKKAAQIQDEKHILKQQRPQGQESAEGDRPPTSDGQNQ